MANNERILSFGDLHLKWQAGRVILDEARQEGIQRVITLGDEAHKIYPFEAGDPMDYKRLWDELRAFRDEDPERVLTCIIGDKTAGVPPDLIRNFEVTDEDGKVKSLVYRDGNVLAVHDGGRIMNGEYRELVEGWDQYEPLVIFHAHSHSMGVLPEYKWLKDDEFVYWLDGEREEHQLEPRSVYWVNPGGNFMRDNNGIWTANFAVYDPQQQTVVLRTERYDDSDIEPTFVSDFPPPSKR